VFHLSEGGPLRLSFDDADGLSVEKEQVVNSPVALLQDELTNRNSWAGADIGVVSLLNKPAGKNELLIDHDSRASCAR
jgi:hypothetical protein